MNKLSVSLFFLTLVLLAQDLLEKNRTLRSQRETIHTLTTRVQKLEEVVLLKNGTWVYKYNDPAAPYSECVYTRIGPKFDEDQIWIPVKVEMAKDFPWRSLDRLDGQSIRFASKDTTHAIGFGTDLHSGLAMFTSHEK